MIEENEEFIMEQKIDLKKMRRYCFMIENYILDCQRVYGSYLLTGIVDHSRFIGNIYFSEN